MLGRKAARILELEALVEKLQSEVRVSQSLATVAQKKLDEQTKLAERLPYIQQASDLKNALIIGTYVDQSIMEFWSPHRDQKVGGYAPLLTQKSYSDLVVSIIFGDETTKVAMIENLRHISEVLKGSNGFRNLSDAINQKFGNIHLDTRLVSTERDYWDEVYQTILRVIRDETRRGYTPGYDLGPYYFVGQIDKKIHRTN